MVIMLGVGVEAVGVGVEDITGLEGFDGSCATGMAAAMVRRVERDAKRVVRCISRLFCVLPSQCSECVECQRAVFSVSTK